MSFQNMQSQELCQRYEILIKRYQRLVQIYETNPKDSQEQQIVQQLLHQLQSDIANQHDAIAKFMSDEKNELDFVLSKTNMKDQVSSFLLCDSSNKYFNQVRSNDSEDEDDFSQ